MAKFNGTKVKVLIGATALSNIEDCSLEINSADIDVTDKDSGGWAEFLAGLKDWTITVSGILDFAGVENVDEIVDDIINGVSASIKFSTTITGDSEFAGTGRYNNISISAPKEDKVSWSATIRGSGPLARNVIA